MGKRNGKQNFNFKMTIMNSYFCKGKSSNKEAENEINFITADRASIIKDVTKVNTEKQS